MAGDRAGVAGPGITVRCGHRLPVGQGRRDRRQGQPRLRRGEEDQRPQAAHRRGHDRAAADHPDHRRQRAGPRRREAAAVEPAQGIPVRPAHLGRQRLCRQAGHLGDDKAQAQAHPPDRQAHRAAHVRRAAPPLGRGAHILLDHQVTPHSPRLRAAPRTPRDDGLLGDDRTPSSRRVSTAARSSRRHFREARGRSRRPDQML